MTEQGGDFYEEDEPLDEVVAAFEQGDKGLTTSRGPGFATALPAHFVAATTNRCGVVSRASAFRGGQIARWVSEDRATANAG